MSQEQPQRPVTYGDVFPNAKVEDGPLWSEPVTMEDAALMQCAESLSFGQTQKGGAASRMQTAAAKNVTNHLVERDAHTMVAEYGLSVSETAVPGAVMDIEYVAGQPVCASARPTPTDPGIAALDAVTIGEALEAAAVGASDKPIDQSDASAIMSAEARATGISMPSKGGIGATAQSAAELNSRVDENAQTTLADVLMDATSGLPADKVVTHEDAEKVLKAELRGHSNVDTARPGGVAAALATAAEMNELAGLILPASDATRKSINPVVSSFTADSEQTPASDSYGINQPASDVTRKSINPNPVESSLTADSEKALVSDSDGIDHLASSRMDEEGILPLINDSEQAPGSGPRET